MSAALLVTALLLVAAVLPNAFVAKSGGVQPLALVIGVVVLSGGLGLAFGLGKWLTIGVLIAFAALALLATSKHLITPRSWLPLLPASLTVAVLAPTSIRLPYNLHDDLSAYLYLAERINQTGSLVDPFNARRLFTMGGSSFIQSLFLTEDGVELLHFSDSVVAPALLAFLCTCVLLQGASSRRHLLPVVSLGFLIGTATGLAAPRDNSSPYVWGVLTLVLASALLVESIRTDANVSVAFASVVSLALVLRLSLAVLLGATLAVYCSLLLRRRAWKESAAFFGSVTAFTGAWAYVSWLSSGAALYPLTRGNEDPSFPGFRLIEEGATWASISRYVLFPGAIAALACVVAGILASTFMSGSWRMATLCLAVGGMSGGVLLVANLTLYHPWDHHRYIWPFFAAMVIVTGLGLALRKKAVSIQSALVVCTVVLIGVGTITAKGYPDAWGPGTFRESARQLTSHGTGTKAGLPGSEVVIRQYRSLQSRVPPGCRVFAAVDFPWAFDLVRNEIATWDLIGFSSPRPHIPLTGDSDALWRYLDDEGFDYALFVDPHAKLKDFGVVGIPDAYQGLYNLDRFRGWTGWADPVKTWAPVYLDRLHMLDGSLTTGARGIHHHASFWIVDLRAARGDSSVSRPRCSASAES